MYKYIIIIIKILKWDYFSVFRKLFWSVSDKIFALVSWMERKNIHIFHQFLYIDISYVNKHFQRFLKGYDDIFHLKIKAFTWFQKFCMACLPYCKTISALLRPYCEAPHEGNSLFLKTSLTTFWYWTPHMIINNHSYLKYCTFTKLSKNMCLINAPDTWFKCIFCEFSNIITSLKSYIFMNRIITCHIIVRYNYNMPSCHIVVGYARYVFFS